MKIRHGRSIPPRPVLASARDNVAAPEIRVRIAPPDAARAQTARDDD